MKKKKGNATGRDFYLLKAAFMTILAKRLIICEHGFREHLHMPDEELAKALDDVFLERAHNEIIEDKKKGTHKTVETFDDLLAAIGHTMDSAVKTITGISKLDIREKSTLKKLARCCNLLSILYRCCYSEDNFTALDICFDHTVVAKSHETLGYWTRKLEMSTTAARTGGEASRVDGETNENRIREILEEHGGISGYDTLGYGLKKPVRDEIEKKLKFRDARRIYSILNLSLIHI